MTATNNRTQNHSNLASRTEGVQDYALANQRLRSGWSREEAFSIPRGITRMQWRNMETVYRLRAEGLTFHQISDRTGLAYATVNQMLNKYLTEVSNEIVDITKPSIAKLWNCSDEGLKNLCSNLSPDELQKLENDLLMISQRAAFLSGYVLIRGASGHGDSGHQQAIASGKRRVVKLRKGLGLGNS